ncbi:hypothetical protein CI610_02899 [invertebrate metagenome]|uniref:Uncharacterized protein n=1 Tax=invertebrate metagenome TaxID=1711999 RepID=A0A2H9T4N7_9ZZZZ
MAKFAIAPEKQAASVIKSLQGREIKSVRTANNFESALTQVARSDFCQSQHLTLRSMTPEQAIQYLEQRGEQVGQKTLDMERQSIQKMMQYVSNKRDPSEKLQVVKSEQQQILNSRAYTTDQVKLIVEAQQPRNALPTEIASAAGLRAHELLTLRPATEKPADSRPALSSKFEGREGQRYTVQGNGGLVREVLIPDRLAERLETLRMEHPQTYTDRGVHYTHYYDINGGNRWSSSFTTAANRSLG